MKKLITLTLCFQLLVPPVWAQTLDETFSTAEGVGLTDAEQTAANNYYHQGVADKVLEEECKKLKTGCNDTTGKPGNVLGGFEDVLPKLYAVMGTLAAAGVGGKIKMKSKSPDSTAAKDAAPAKDGAASDAAKTDTAGKDAAGKDAKAEKKEKTDICIYIPMAGEAISSVTQKQNEEKIAENVAADQSDMQKKALYAVADTHKSRAKTAKMQGSIYAATGACYVAYLAMGAVMDASLAIKMGASVAMSAIFFKKAANHQKYADKLMEIAKKLPGAGDCNPYSNATCFCAEDTSYKTDASNFTKYCVPKAIANNGAAGTQLACVTLSSTGQAVSDLSCQCKKTNSCANAQIRGLAGQIGLGSIGFTDPLSVLDNMNGSLNSGALDTIGGNLNAVTSKALQNGVAGIPTVSTSGKTKEIADKINRLGIPANVSAALASQQSAALPDSAASAPSLSSDDSTTTTKGTSAAQLPGYNAAGSRYGGGGDGGGYVDPMAALNKGNKPSAVQIETFAEKAIREADITNDPSRGLFEIISNRYRANGWGAGTVAPSNPTP